MNWNWISRDFGRSSVHPVLKRLVETHIFSFVVGGAFITDVEKLKISSKTRSLDVENVLRFFSEVTKDGISPGSNLSTAMEVLVSGPIDKQSFLDSGILCYLIHILNVPLSPEVKQRQKATNYEVPLLLGKDHGDVGHARWLDVVAIGSLTIFSRYKEGLVPLRSIQLHRHAMQVDALEF
ncbi:hypothetical protein GH714_025864 [Hevea brasiliensis]|uniref:Uncharacterized protein n=1 Tax=Hevea brasiliensis TaxID=3981 RepID=A0A6A6NK50_HEVBR|nr:hypothetical protein GH714_025864 [Hevea brasiliensis]